MKTKWSQSGNNFTLDYGSTTSDVLPAGVYNIQASKQGLFLEKRPTGFVLPKKLYGLEQAFIDRVLTTFEKTSGNLGILLNGIRGTGKTVTAEILSEKLNQPIILVCQDFPGLVDFMDSIPHSVTFLCDEFEKVFSQQDGNLSIGGQQERGASKLLPLMDGVMNSAHRKAFILTTNNLRVDENLIQRPGRIRYLKTFSNLSRDGIEMIVNDLLENKDSRPEVIDFIARLELITIDIVTTLIEEMNIHGGSVESLDGIFNVKKLRHEFEVQRVDMETMEEEGKRLYGCSVEPFPLSNKNIGDDFYVNDNDYGEIKDIKGEYVTLKRHNHTTSQDEDVLLRVTARPAYNIESFGKAYSKNAL